MGKVTPFRQRARWTRPADDGVRAPATRINWFPILLVALPLAAFTAVFLLGGPPSSLAVPAARVAPDREVATFPICGRGPRITCVVDGDTIWYRGDKIRIADIDTPEVSKPGCAREARLGSKATRRLQAMLNADAFTLAPNPDGRDRDKYGRLLRVVTRDGASVGDRLVSEGLAERWGGPTVAWCERKDRD
ncbi:thermonuclease family protein [Parerythrobacter jejuensis]|uniref:Thermonuclease family protein n=1 Tax=Parerythrobacter jejuensis TaxID=795812 RepID=A0A845AZR3_9SPHN|nr:thermonuclease family protein [Parerythrobacter jejuensis]MXP31226.1 thermonuclease family protein [Parerythrobacter jejuensis]MXP33986.1 thermonuclease family protein [Parerythrobacter jejuensis]